MGKLAATLLIASSFTAGWWTVETINWDLFYPTPTYSGPAMRHRMKGDERWVEKFNEEKQVWEWAHMDWKQPPGRPMDPRYLGLDHVPNDGQRGFGMPDTKGQDWYKGARGE